jgi:hydroxymethylpyrimidine/phosphomethylpyrimidine kinase
MTNTLTPPLNTEYRIPNTSPRILIIAGSDSSGGAGIQADIKTVTMLGGYAMTAITALTAQNTLGVKGVHAVPPEFVAQQIQLCVDDIGVDVIKTGMLLNAAIIEAIAEALPSCPLVLDPVMISTSGATLLEPDAIHALTTRLLPRATLITPNIPEAELLSGMAIQTRDDMERAAAALETICGSAPHPSPLPREREASAAPPRTGKPSPSGEGWVRGNPAILLKGGHAKEDTVYDLLWQNGQPHWFSSPRLHSPHTHGTGCTLASAIATELGKGQSLIASITTARTYVHHAIATAPGFGQRNGPLNHLHPLRKVNFH